MNKQTVLAKLRDNVESTETRPDGSKWGEVYLPNVGSGHQFAGLLSTLAKDGLYEQQDQTFGLVKL